jgi:hypothetical protein
VRATRATRRSPGRRRRVPGRAVPGRRPGRITPAPPPVPPARPGIRRRGHATTTAAAAAAPRHPGRADPRRCPGEAAWAAVGAPRPRRATAAARPRRSRGSSAPGGRSSRCSGCSSARRVVAGRRRWTSMPTVVGSSGRPPSGCCSPRTSSRRSPSPATTTVPPGWCRRWTRPGRAAAARQRGTAHGLERPPSVPAVAAGTPVAAPSRPSATPASRPRDPGPPASTARRPRRAAVGAHGPCRGRALPSGARVTLVISRGAEPPRQGPRAVLIAERRRSDRRLAAVASGRGSQSGSRSGCRPADDAQVVRPELRPGSHGPTAARRHPRAFWNALQDR